MSKLAPLLKNLYDGEGTSGLGVTRLSAWHAILMATPQLALADPCEWQELVECLGEALSGSNSDSKPFLLHRSSAISDLYLVVFVVALRVVTGIAKLPSLDDGSRAGDYLLAAEDIMKNDITLRVMRQEAVRAHFDGCLLTIFERIAVSPKQHARLLCQFFEFLRRSQLSLNILDHLISNVCRL